MEGALRGILVETKTKMTNDLAFALQVFKFLNELFSRLKCDLVDVTTDFIGTHANAVIFDRYGLFALIQQYVKYRSHQQSEDLP